LKPVAIELSPLRGWGHHDCFKYVDAFDEVGTSAEKRILISCPHAICDCLTVSTSNSNSGLIAKLTLVDFNPSVTV
jgi:hypothetical protein